MGIKKLFNSHYAAPRKTNTGRPRKCANDRRSRKLSSAYTPAEYEQLKESAAQSGMSLCVYQREAALNATVDAVDKEAGLRLDALRKLLSQARYCRAELHKIERLTEGLDANDRGVMTRIIARVEKLISTITKTLRKEAGLDPD